jgi:hypothetical protein
MLSMLFEKYVGDQAMCLVFFPGKMFEIHVQMSGERLFYGQDA